MRIQHGMSEVPVTAAVPAAPSVERKRKEPELCEPGRGNRKKAICVVRARQERTGILYTDCRLVKKPEDVLSAFGKLFDRAGVEMLYAAALTKRGEPVAVQLIAVGSVDSCMVSVPEILKLALLSNCPSFLLVHNHPSGDSCPSEEDRAITERVEKAAEIVGIQLLDHLIVGDRRNGYSIKYGREVHLPELWREPDPERTGETGVDSREKEREEKDRRKDREKTTCRREQKSGVKQKSGMKQNDCRKQKGA